MVENINKSELMKQIEKELKAMSAENVKRVKELVDILSKEADRTIFVF